MQRPTLHQNLRDHMTDIEKQSGQPVISAANFKQLASRKVK